MPIPLTLTSALNEFKERLLEKFLKGLPPRRMVDHRIKLEVGSKLMMKAPYRLYKP
jgi:hypothetical protein